MSEVFEGKGDQITRDNDTESSEADGEQGKDDDFDSEYSLDRFRHQVNKVITSEVKIGEQVRGKEEDLLRGTMLAQSKKLCRDITDWAWNRYLPDWFVQDDQKHMKKNNSPKIVFGSYKKRVEATS
ncbi:hypothetical protein QAD02_021520 [Eretmocerus hayati]|uniref:Uncharacterized protein n=1 Tax=Eretmocerus hayati TaxID=131215 RepID=A0ACC2PQP6_9HYME|nr:hypothetical protein QAD02_021520 [Eretmocerus hayati]